LGSAYLYIIMTERKTTAVSSVTSPSILASPFTLTSPISLQAPQSARSGASTTSPTAALSGLSARNSLDLDARIALSRTQSHIRTASTAPIQDGLFLTRANQPPRLTGQDRSQSESDRTDALWAEMQATLAEVELSAARGTHFFGPAHGAALEELRNAQIALAQAWARGESDELRSPINASRKGSNDSERSPGSSITGETAQKATSNATGTNDGDGDFTGGRDSAAEQDAEKDILAARKRREANDRYFYRVSQGVMDVVGKLEEVAAAMGKVERESREIWSEEDSITSGTTGNT
jgi:hypothetical protein